MKNSDGSEDDKSKPKGLPNYVVPPPTFLEPSEQNIVDCTIPKERHIDIVEKPLQLGNNTELVESKKEKRYIFDSIDELVLEPQ